MAFDGSGIYSKLAGSVAVSATTILSNPYNLQWDDAAAALNSLVLLNGLKPMTGLQLLSGDGTNVLHAATTKQVQQEILSKASVVGGTVDVITITMSPASVAWVTKETFEWVSGGANVSTTPTLNKDGLGAKTIVSSTGGALVAGATGVSGVLNRGYYDGTNVRLLTPQASTFVGGTLTATTSMSAAAFNEAATTIASAGTMNIGAAAANKLTTTGTTTVTAFDTVQAGTERTLRFGGIQIITHNATSLICLTGASITTAVGDIAVFVSLGSGNWYMKDYTRLDGSPVIAPGTSGNVLKSNGSVWQSAAPASSGAPLPQTGAGVGQWGSASCGTGASISLPASGTWAWFTFSSTSPPINSGISAGGTSIISTTANYGGAVYWRIT